MRGDAETSSARQGFNVCHSELVSESPCIMRGDAETSSARQLLNYLIAL